MKSKFITKLLFLITFSTSYICNANDCTNQVSKFTCATQWTHEKEANLLISKVAISYNGLALKYTNNEIKNNKKIVLTAVKQNGLALEFASKRLQKDKAIVMAALKNNGNAYQFVDDSLKQDKTVILQAVKNGIWTILRIDNELIDKEIILAAVKKEPNIFDYIEDKYKNDNDVITAVAIKASYIVNRLNNQPINNKKDMLNLLKHGTSLKVANNKLRDNKELVLAAISNDASNFLFASQRIKNDKQLILDIFTNKKNSDNLDLLEGIAKKFKNDKNFMLKLVSTNGLALKYASNRLKRDKQVVLTALRQAPLALKFADSRFKKDQKIVINVIKKDGYALRYADPRYQKNKKIVLLAVKSSSEALKFADYTLKADRDVVLAAVQNSGFALQYAAETLTKDKDIVLTAIKDHYSYYKYAHKSLFKNKAFILELIQKTGSLPFPLDSSLQQDPDIANLLNKHDGLYLKNLSKKLQSDKKIVKAAVTNNGLALQYANKEFQNDPEIVSVAIKQNILALKYAGGLVRQNKQWILAYIKNSGIIPQWINDKLIQDKSFIQAIIDEKPTHLRYRIAKIINDKVLLLSILQIDGMALQYANKILRKDKEVVLAAVKQEGDAFQYANNNLLSNKNVVLDAIKIDGRAYYYASKKLQSDKDIILAALHQKINVLKLLTEQPENKSWQTTDTHYSIQRIKLKNSLVIKNTDILTNNGNFVFSPNGLLFAAATELATGRAQIKIWSTENGKLLHSTILNSLPVSNYHGLIFSPDSKRLINIEESDSEGFIWNFDQENDLFFCGTGNRIVEINTQTHSMLTDFADAPLSLYSLDKCDQLGYSEEFNTTSPYVISPDNKMIIRDNTFINNQKYEQILVEWDNKTKERVFRNRNYISNKNYWKKIFPHSEESLGSISYYPDYKTRKLFFLDKKYIWIIDIDTGDIIKRFPYPNKSIIKDIPSYKFSYLSEQPFIISNDNKIMVIDGGEDIDGKVELISLDTGKIIHTIKCDSGKLLIPPPVPEGIRNYCPNNYWVCLFTIKTSVSPNGQFILYGKYDSSSILIDSQNEKTILKLPALIRSDMIESKTGETMVVTVPKANIMFLWKIKRIVKGTTNLK